MIQSYPWPGFQDSLGAHLTYEQINPGLQLEGNLEDKYMKNEALILMWQWLRLRPFSV